MQAAQRDRIDGRRCANTCGGNRGYSGSTASAAGVDVSGMVAAAIVVLTEFSSSAVGSVTSSRKLTRGSTTYEAERPAKRRPPPALADDHDTRRSPVVV